MKTYKITSRDCIKKAVEEIIDDLTEPYPPYNTYKDKIYYLAIQEEEKYKTDRQNKLFHALLQAYWESNCSSFLSYDDLRNHYKRFAGLIELKYINSLPQETKKILYKGIKLLPIDDKEKEKAYDLLKGRMEYCRSWAEVSKDKATFAIQQLINDCIQSGAYGGSSKVKSIIDEIDDERFTKNNGVKK
jgi:hypothetical protein